MLCSLIAVHRPSIFSLRDRRAHVAQGGRGGERSQQKDTKLPWDGLNKPLFTQRCPQYRRSFFFFLELRARSCIRDWCRKEEENDVCVQASSLTTVYAATKPLPLFIWTFFSTGIELVLIVFNAIQSDTTLLFWRISCWNRRDCFKIKADLARLLSMP